jgi:erythromycin esterase
MKRLALVFLVAGLFLAGVPVNADNDADLRGAIKVVDELTAAEFAKYGTGSITVGVVAGRKLIWTRSYGYADAEKKELATKDSVYRIGGVTSKFTGLMLLQLVQAGKVSLSDPVEKYYPEINLIQGRDPAAKPVTFLQLAVHIGGIANEPDNMATYTRGPVANWEQTLLAALPHTKYVATPGTKYVYSNIGTAVMGAALSRIAGEPYISYVEKRIFAPLGMKHTSFEPNDITRPRLTKGYAVSGPKLDKVDTSVPEIQHQGRGYKVPSGAVYTTVVDMARYTSFELGQGPDSVLKKKTLEENYKYIEKLAHPTDEIIGYGVGFQEVGCSDLSVLGYGGFVPGYHARSDFHWAAGVGFIVLRNVEGGRMHESTRTLSCNSLSKLVASRNHSSRSPKSSFSAPSSSSQDGSTDNEQVNKWLTSHAITLKSVEENESFADLKPLKQVLRGVRIVGLGEGTHGTHEFFGLKRRLVEFLVKEEGFTLFAMELSYAASSAINEYVLYGKGDRDKALARQGLWAWDTQEVSELLEWLRQYNSSVPAEKKVRFIGIDFNSNTQALELVSNYLAKVAPERLEAFKRTAQHFGRDDSQQHLEYTIQVSATDKVQTLATLNELLGFLYLNQTRFTQQTSAAEFAQAFENAAILAEFADTYRRPPRVDPANPLNSSRYTRDMYMAQNIKQRIKEEKPGTRIIIWAHNDHVGKYKNALGSYLQSAYGPEYYALGFSFNKGGFQAREMAPNVTIGPLKEFSVDAAPEDSVEWYLNRTGIRNFIIDFRNTAKNKALDEWLTKPKRMRSIGLGFFGATNSFLRVNLQQTFDGLVFIETTTRARPNPTGVRGAWVIPEKAQNN